MTARSPALVSWLVVAPVAACAFAAAVLPRADLAWASALALLPWGVLALDVVDALVRLLAVWRRPRVRSALVDETAGDAPRWRRDAGVEACAFVAVVHDLGHDVDAWIARRTPLRDATWLAHTGSADATRLRLCAAGWRCTDHSQAGDDRAALAQLVSGLPAGISTVVVLDADADFLTAIDVPERFALALRDFERGPAVAVCPRTFHVRDSFAALVSHEQTQREFALEGRSLGLLAPLTPNAVYRRDVLQRLLADSRRPSAGIADDALVLLGAGETIVCDERLEVRVPAPRGFGAWLARAAQRRAASSRAFWTRRREIVSVVRRGPLAFYHFALHAGALRLIASPLRLAATVVLLASFFAACLELAGVATGGAAIADPGAFVPIFAGYLLLHLVTAALAERRGERLSTAALAPLSLVTMAAQSLVPLAAWFARDPVPRNSSVPRASEVSCVAQ